MGKMIQTQGKCHQQKAQPREGVKMRTETCTIHIVPCLSNATNTIAEMKILVSCL